MHRYLSTPFLEVSPRYVRGKTAKASANRPPALSADVDCNPPCAALPPVQEHLAFLNRCVEAEDRQTFPQEDAVRRISRDVLGVDEKGPLADWPSKCWLLAVGCWPSPIFGNLELCNWSISHKFSHGNDLNPWLKCMYVGAENHDGDSPGHILGKW